MEKLYLLTEAELLELIEDRIKLAALENTGVNNWYRYEEAKREQEEIDPEEVLENYQVFN